ncbi:dTDP-4-dehydrorhamnose reductase [bacterium]|nr:dTDP-4-dehydrorhamnose reductase [candidate division CSSED10-310 bacterium]
MKYLVTGASGMLGRDLVSCLSETGSVDAVDIEDFDITDLAACMREIRDRRPETVIHAAAFTQVDRCETDIELAMKTNGEGAGNIARACHFVGASMVFFSTDYVFNGQSDRPYTESDRPDPVSVYGQSKLEGETEVVSMLPEDHLIIRTAWLFGEYGKNFVDTLIGLARSRGEVRVVDDQHGCPTYTRDLARATRQLIQNGIRGIVNVTNSGSTTWFGFASHFLSRMQLPARVIPVSTSEYVLPARRPAFSVLAPDKFNRIAGTPMPRWTDAVDRYLAAKYRVHNRQEKFP